MICHVLRYAPFYVEIRKRIVAGELGNILNIQTSEHNVSNDMHGSGDLRLVEDFVRVVRGEEPSISTTSIEDSVYGHLIGFRADKARIEGRVLEI